MSRSRLGIAQGLFVFIFLAFYKWGDEFWRSKWAAVAAIGAFLWVRSLFMWHWSVALFFASLMLSSVYPIFWLDGPWAHMGLFPVEKMYLEMTGTHALLCLFLLIPFMWVRARTWATAFFHFCLANSLWTILQYTWEGARPPLGLIGMPGLSSAMTAISAPFVPGWWKLIPVIAVLFSNSTMAYGVMGLVLTVLGYRHLRGQWRWSAMILTPLLIATGSLFQNRMTLSTRGRIDFWEKYLDWWSTNVNLFYGSGVGTTNYWLPSLLTDAAETKTNVFLSIWLHNDWLTILGEQGLFGLVSALILFACSLKRAWPHPPLAAAWIGYGAAGIGQFLPHTALSALAGIGLLTMIWRPHGRMATTRFREA